METADLAQTTLLSALRRLDEFQPRREGAFLAYLREILLNCIRKELRIRPAGGSFDTLDESSFDPSPSPVEQVMGRDALMRYEQALTRLPAKQKEAVILRVEFGFSHQEVADALECPSAGAARMMVSRALAELAEAMG